MDLYLDKLPELDHAFRKEAGLSIRLSENAQTWPQELHAEIFKQLPFLSDYDVNINLDRVEPNRGYAFGYADVANKTERPEAEHAEAGMPHIRIPIIVQDRAAKAFSIFLDGERVLPLTEDRVRETLFNPATFDISGAAPRDPSLVESLTPPQRSGMGMGGEYKMASADPEALLYASLSGKAKEASLPAAIRRGGGGEYGGYRRAAKSAGDFASSIISSYRHNKAETGASKELAAVFARNRKKGGQTLVRDTISFGKELKNDSRALSKAKTAERAERCGSVAVSLIKSKAGKAKHAEAMPDPTVDWSNCQCPWHAGKKQEGSLLKAIAPTIGERDAERFVEKISSDQTLIAGFRRNGIAPTLVDVFEHTKRASAGDRLETLAESIEPTVVTLQKLPGGDFLVKSANVNAFSEKTAEGEVVPQQEAAQAIGPQAAQQMQPGQTATAVSEPVPAENLEPEGPSKAKLVEEFGQYKVVDAMGNALLGHVFPTTLSWDGFTPQDVSLFTNGSAYAVQESIAGELVGKGTNLPDDEPRGDGAFYFVEGGEAIATAPVTIGSTVVGPDGQARLMATDIFGRPMQLVVTEGLKQPQRLSDTEIAIPDAWVFMRLNNQTQLEQSPEQLTKMSQAHEAPYAVTLMFNGAYHLKGGCGLEKVSRDLRYDLDPLTAEFMLGVLGVDGATAKVKLSEARRYGGVELAGLKTIVTLGERFADSVKTASALLSRVPDLRRDLTKEAAALEDEGTVDNLLALGFINPENITTFIGYIPELEGTSEKLAEMLLHSYLGQKEIPEAAVENAMKALEEVLTALKALASEEG